MRLVGQLVQLTGVDRMDKANKHKLTLNFYFKGAFSCIDDSSDKLILSSNGSNRLPTGDVCDQRRPSQRFLYKDV